jgi:hypothetical protein
VSGGQFDRFLHLEKDQTREKGIYLHLSSTIKCGGSIWTGTVAQYSLE